MTKKAPKWKNRPKWAKPLSALLWEHVCESAADPSRPTLAGVKRNRAGQLKDGITCHECEAVAHRLGLD